jgi:hypothetical protein
MTKQELQLMNTELVGMLVRMRELIEDKLDEVAEAQGYIADDGEDEDEELDDFEH